jgi:hypothetical protein
MDGAGACLCSLDLYQRCCICVSFSFSAPIAEDYHQDYYIKNPSDYGYYKNACGRPKRLKEVWGEKEYTCYHEETHTCFIDIDTDNNTTATTTISIVNADGELVAAESNIKNVDAETAGWLPKWAIAVFWTLITCGICGAIYLVYKRGYRACSF